MRKYFPGFRGNEYPPQFGQRKIYCDRVIFIFIVIWVICKNPLYHCGPANLFLSEIRNHLFLWIFQVFGVFTAVCKFKGTTYPSGKWKPVTRKSMNRNNKDLEHLKCLARSTKSTRHNLLFFAVIAVECMFKAKLQAKCITRMAIRSVRKVHWSHDTVDVTVQTCA